MPTSLLSCDPVAALNARALARGWTFSCDWGTHFDAPLLAEMNALWQSCATAGKLPARADFPARALRSFLRQLIVIDIIHTPEKTRFLYRNVGSTVVRYLGEMTGAYMDEYLPPLPLERTTACYQAIIAARRPLRFLTRFSLDNIKYLSAEFIGVPLASDGVTPDKILSVTHFRDPSLMS